MARPASASRTLHRLLALSALVIVLAASWWLWSGRTQSPASGFRTGNVERGDVRVVISATGTLRATTTVAVGSQVSGQVKSVAVDFNDQVSKDQPIAMLDSAPFQTRLKQAQADLASARASVNEAKATQRNAEADYARKSDLLARQLIARSDADLAMAAREQASARVASAQAAVQQRQAGVDNAELDVAYTVIRSPVDGVILLRAVEPGQTVAASFQTPVLFQIAEDLAQMQIVTAQKESALKVPNAALRFTPPGQDAAVSATGASGGRGGLMQDLPRVADALKLDATQRAAFDMAMEGVLERAAARTAGRAPAAPPGGMGGGGRGPSGQAAAASGGPSPEAMRQRMAEAMERNFVEFRASLSDEQQTTWDAELRAISTARRGTLWKLVDGQPQSVAVRLGASDGTVIAEGDAVIIGQERPAA